MNSISYFHSAATFRVLDALGIFSRDMPCIKTDKYKQKKFDGKTFWAGKLQIDGDTWVAILYTEDEKGTYNKYAASTLIDSQYATPLWQLVVCGDDSGESPDANKIFTETLSVVPGSEQKKIVITQMSCFDLCDYVKGFEYVQQYVPMLLPFEVPLEFLSKFNSLINEIETKTEENDN